MPKVGLRFLQLRSDPYKLRPKASSNGYRVRTTYPARIESHTMRAFGISLRSSPFRMRNRQFTLPRLDSSSVSVDFSQVGALRSNAQNTRLRQPPARLRDIWRRDPWQLTVGWSQYRHGRCWWEEWVRTSGYARAPGATIGCGVPKVEQE